MLQKILLKAGVNREGTSYASEGGWYECDKVRFRKGMPEKIGGWLRKTSNMYQGICRALYPWLTNEGLALLGMGTHLKYYIDRSGTLNDITPLRTTEYSAALNNAFAAVATSTTLTVTDATHGAQVGDLVTFSGATGLGGNITAAVLNIQYTIATVIGANSYTVVTAVAATAGDVGLGGAVTATYAINADTLGANPFSTTNGSTTVTITDVANGALANDFATFSGGTAVGGLTLNGEYQIVSILTADTYTITAASAATSTATGGGTAVLAAYQMSVGASISVPTVGWGGGLYGLGPWGTGAAATTSLRLWSQSNFGEDLVFGPRGGALYYWDNSNGVTTRGIKVSNKALASSVPLMQNLILVSDTSRIVLVFGTNDYGATTMDPLLIRWSDQENIVEWFPAVTNMAGSLRLSQGSEIVGATLVRQEILVWTDIALYALQFLGAPDVWGSTLLASNISIASQNSHTTASGVTYWMGIDKFYKYDGRFSTLRCDIWQTVFTDFNRQQLGQVLCGTNEGFSEIWWFYCSVSSTTVDKYAVYNYEEDVWYYGNMARTAWVDSGGANTPLAATYSSNLVYHESGLDDGTDGINGLLPIEAYVTSAQFDIGDGHNFAFVNKVIPDMTFRGSTAASPSATLTLQPMSGSGGGNTTPASVGGNSSGTIARSATVPVEAYTEQINIRVRGRQMTIKIASTDLGVAWQMGAPRIDIRPDGRA